MLNVKMDTKDIVLKLSNISEGIKKAQISANTKTAQQGLTFAKKKIREEYNIKAAKLNESTKVIRASEGNPARIRATGKGLSLKYFGAKQKSAGVQVEVLKGQRKIITSAFGPKISRLGGNVFERTGKERLPIKKLLGPGAAKMLSSKRVMPPVMEFIKQNYERIFSHEIAWFTKK